MASFRIHEDQENHSSNIAGRKDNVENTLTQIQRRALGDLNHINNEQKRNPKQNVNENFKRIELKPSKASSKPIVPPVAQFKAISVYEDPETEEPKKREVHPKPFSIYEDPGSDRNAGKADAKRLIKGAKEEHLKLLPCKRVPLQDKLKNESLDFKNESAESPMSVVLDSTLASSPETVTKAGDEEESRVEEVKACARTDRERFFHVAEYREDIYKYMRDIEKKHRANPGYMRKQPDISHGMRAILVDWLVEVGEEYRLQSETLHLAVSYVDRFLSFMSVVRGKLQLVGTAATFIAAKYEEIYPPDVNEFVYITDDTYNKRQVLRMEQLVLKVLSFDLSAPTALAFVSHLCIAAGLSRKLLYLAMYISELSLLESDPYLQFYPSLVGAACVATARHCLLCSCGAGERDGSEACARAAWPVALALASGYSAAQMEACLRALARTHAHASLQPHQAIPDKYKTTRFEHVSSILPRPMYPVPAYQQLAPARPAEPALSVNALDQTPALPEPKPVS